MGHAQPPDSPMNGDLQMVAMLACELHDGPCQRLAAAFHHFEALAACNWQTRLRPTWSSTGAWPDCSAGCKSCESPERPPASARRTSQPGGRHRGTDSRANRGARPPGNVLARPEDLALSLPVQTAVFRIVQEGLANVCRHSRSATARVAITRTTGSVRIEIDDKGCGFDPATVAGDCFGLVAMRPRRQCYRGPFGSPAARGKARSWWPKSPRRNGCYTMDAGAFSPHTPCADRCRATPSQPPPGSAHGVCGLRSLTPPRPLRTIPLVLPAFQDSTR